MDRLDRPVLSIITATFNRREKLQRAVDSVLAQSHNSWELIIVDDGSSDGTAEELSTYATKDSRIKTKRLDNNCGVNFARNQGVKLSTAPWVMFLDSDNQLTADAVAKISERVTNSKFKLNFFSCRSIGGAALPTSHWERATVNFQEYLRQDFYGEYLPVVSKELLLNFPLIEKLQGGERIIWSLILKKESQAAVHLDTVLIYDDQGPDRLSSRWNNIDRLGQVFGCDLATLWPDYLRLAPLRLSGILGRFFIYQGLSLINRPPTRR